MVSRGNKIEGKTQRSYYLPDEVLERLRVAAFEERVSQSVIVERALRKELGLMKREYWKHRENGEIWAVELDESGLVTRSAGPLGHEEITAANLNDVGVYQNEWTTDNNKRFNAWASAQGDEFAVVKPMCEGEE